VKPDWENQSERMDSISAIGREYNLAGLPVPVDALTQIKARTTGSKKKFLDVIATIEKYVDLLLDFPIFQIMYLEP
jgi:hypothetical protein